MLVLNKEGHCVWAHWFAVMRFGIGEGVLLNWGYVWGGGGFGVRAIKTRCSFDLK